MFSPHHLSLSALTAICAAATAPAAPAQSTSGAHDARIAAFLLEDHNRERQYLNLLPMSWDAKLAQQASTYAAQLASTGAWRHSDPKSRPGQGENLWMGTGNKFSPEEMFRDWASERAVFKPGVFPNVSETGNWQHVGHYTQIVWPDTVRVGCGLRSSTDYDYLVCRYTVSGNVFGRRVGAIALTSR